MQIYLDNRLPKRKALQGKIGLGIGFVAMIIAIIFLFQLDPRGGAYTYVPAYGAIILGFLAFTFGSRYFQEWGKQPTPYTAITNALRGSHKKTALFSFLPHILKVQHLLLTPWGLFVLLPKHVEGKVIVKGDQWKLVPLRRLSALVNPWSQVRLGKPVQQAAASRDFIRRFVEQILGADEAATVQVESVVVITNPTATLEAEDSTVPVLATQELRTFISSNSQHKIPPATYDKLLRALGGQFKPEEEERAKPSRPRRKKQG